MGRTEKNILRDEDRRSGAFLKDFLTRHRVELTTDADSDAGSSRDGRSDLASRDFPRLPLAEERPPTT